MNWQSTASYSFSITNRGYTGHEHLLQFGLINMNGRMYDPLLARMLSPDPFVPNPALSQDYNRYSYVRNNPLKYTDPSGYFPWPTILKRLYRKGVTLISGEGRNKTGFNLFEYTGHDVSWVDNFSFIDPLPLDTYSAPGSPGMPGSTGTLGGGPAPGSGDPPTVLDLLKTYHKSYLDFRQRYHNQHIDYFNNQNSNQICKYLYTNSYLEPDIEISEETGIFQIAEINYINVTSQNGYVELGNFVFDENTVHEYYPYFSYSATNPYSRFWYENIVIITQDGYYEIFIQWWVPFSL